MNIKYRPFLLLLMTPFVCMISSCSEGDKEASPVVPEYESHIIDTSAYSENQPVEKWDIQLQVEADIPAAIAAMSLEEKVGQMIQTDVDSATPDEVTKYFIGSLITLDPKGNMGTAEVWREMVDIYQDAALSTRTEIPMAFGIDAVHGHSYFDGASVILPHNIGLGATRNPQLVKKLAQMTARELTATGIRWTFSPTIAVARNIRWGRTYESFGEDVELQKMFAGVMVEGYQGKDLTSDSSIGATVKHFIADGATENGRDRGDAKISDQEMRSMHLPGFIDAIDKDVAAVMASFSSLNGEALHGSKKILTDLLKNELAFKGVILTDWEGLEACGLTIKQGLDAGLDMFMFALSWKQNLKEMIELVESGEVAMERIDDAVSRILRMKLRLRLFSKPMSSDAQLSQVGSKENRDIARQAVRESLVLLKNKNKTLPLSKDHKVIVVGAHADNIAYQCGGWTKKWQGAHQDRFYKPARPVLGATSILDGIKQVIGAENVIFAGNNHQRDGADTVIVVVGEKPYAEGFGDEPAEGLALPQRDLHLIEKYKDVGARVITIVISGRPLVVNEELKLSDAFVAAWLPGSEGKGIAEVLFGDYNFKGKLGFSWPRSADQIPIHVGDENYDPLFPYGFGLTY